MFRFLIAPLLGAALVAGNAFAEPCHMGRVGALDVTWQDNRALVPVGINGHTVAAVVDTGASRSVLFRNGADALGLNSVVGAGRAYGFGGAARVSSAQISE